MFSHADGFEVTPLQLGTLVSAMANGGRLLQPQIPHSVKEAAKMSPKVRRQLDITNDVWSRMVPGMVGAVNYGSGRKAYDPTQTVAGAFKENAEYTAADFRFTAKGDSLYAISLGEPRGQVAIPSLGLAAGHVRRAPSAPTWSARARSSPASTTSTSTSTRCAAPSRSTSPTSRSGR
jgi:hypothetical protein